MFEKVLVANRGEIAVRIVRTLREMGIASVAVFSDADREALFVQEADEAYRLGGAPAAESYLDVAAILEVVQRAGADSVHPGYGFLAENADFADSVISIGRAFIGPSPASMRLMGNKVQARQTVTSLNVPTVPGTTGAVTHVEQARAFGREYGYPVAVKASGGGGGRGIRVVGEPKELEAALTSARREAEAYFKNPEVYLERYYHDPRHIEIQVLGDRRGNVLHLGERDCSVQRRHQKAIEESPSPVVDRALRERIGDVALRVAESAGYFSAGTVEFLLTREGEVFFLEMNTRIQVEHPVTELVADVDLVKEMILVAAGESMTVATSLLDPRGHAIEVRINAEDPAQNFRPTPATLSRYREPGGIGIRVDSGVCQGYTIPSAYDSLMSKLIAWAPDRESARRRSLRALREYVVEGPRTTIPFARAILEHETYRAGQVGTTFVETHLDELVPQEESRGSGPVAPSADEVARTQCRTYDVEVNRKLFRVRVAEVGPSLTDAVPGRQRARKVRTENAATHGPDLLSPMHGTLINIKKSVGDQVNEGEALFVIEAMKMENDVPAHRSGLLSRICVSVGETVEARTILAQID